MTSFRFLIVVIFIVFSRVIGNNRAVITNHNNRRHFDGFFQVSFLDFLKVFQDFSSLFGVG